MPGSSEVPVTGPTPTATPPDLKSQPLSLPAEVVHPMRFGYLWRTSSIFKKWQRRWYAFQNSQLSCAESPEATHLGKPLLPSAIVDAQPLDGRHLNGTQALYPFRLRSSCGKSETLYAEDASVRDDWLLVINDTVSIMTGAKKPMVLTDRYQVHLSSVLGTGLFATVFKAKEVETGVSHAIKIIKPKVFLEYRDMLQTELLVWSAAGLHPNILRLKDVFISKTRMYFISEMCAGGGLLEGLVRATSYSEQDAASIMRRVLEALHHMHQLGLVHCDVKPENICLGNRATDWPVKLIDFSLAAFFNAPMSVGGTPEFVAPELMTDPEQYADHGCTSGATDMWSTGVLLFYLLSGQTPFYASSPERIIAKVKAARWSFKALCWAEVSDLAKDLIKGLLQQNPNDRLSARQALAHPWLTRPASTKPLESTHAVFKAQYKPSEEPASPISRSTTRGVDALPSQQMLGVGGDPHGGPGRRQRRATEDNFPDTIMSFSKTAANETRKAVRRSQSYGLLPVPQLQPQPTFPLPLPVAPSYGPQWGNFGDTAARFNNTASVQHNTLAHTPVASHPISSAQHALSQVPSQQSLVDSERASRAMQILELQKQLEDLKASIANGGTGKAEAKVEAYPTQQQSGSSAASGRNSHAGGGRTSHAGGGTLPGQAHEGVLAGTSLSGCRSPLDTHDLLTALPSSQHVLRNRAAGNAPFFMSAGQVNVSLPECFPGQAFTGGAANIGGNDSRGIGGQVQQSSQTSSQALATAQQELRMLTSMVSNRRRSALMTGDVPLVTASASVRRASCFTPDSGQLIPLMAPNISPASESQAQLQWQRMQTQQLRSPFPPGAISANANAPGMTLSEAAFAMDRQARSMGGNVMFSTHSQVQRSGGSGSASVLSAQTHQRSAMAQGKDAAAISGSTRRRSSGESSPLLDPSSVGGNAQTALQRPSPHQQVPPESPASQTGPTGTDRRPLIRTASSRRASTLNFINGQWVE